MKRIFAIASIIAMISSLSLTVNAAPKKDVKKSAAAVSTEPFVTGKTLTWETNDKAQNGTMVVTSTKGASFYLDQKNLKSAKAGITKLEGNFKDGKIYIYNKKSKETWVGTSSNGVVSGTINNKIKFTIKAGAVEPKKETAEVKKEAAPAANKFIGKWTIYNEANEVNVDVEFTADKVTFSYFQSGESGGKTVKYVMDYKFSASPLVLKYKNKKGKIESYSMSYKFEEDFFTYKFLKKYETLDTSLYMGRDNKTGDFIVGELKAVKAAKDPE